MRPWSRDCVGLSHLNDGQNQFPTRDAGEGMHPQAKEVADLGDPVQFVVISSPLFRRESDRAADRDDDEDGGAQREEWLTQLKGSIRDVNRRRPKLAVAVGSGFDLACRKLLAKVNETIPVILCDGSEHFSFWCCGAQGIALRSADFVVAPTTIPPNGGDEATTTAGGGATDDDGGVDQDSWLREELEQSRTAEHHLFVFADCDPRSLPSPFLRRLARGKALCLFGISSPPSSSRGGDGDESPMYESTVHFEGKTAGGSAGGGGDNDDRGGGEGEESSEGDGDDSVESSNEKPRAMKVTSSSANRLHCVTLEDYGVWRAEDI